MEEITETKLNLMTEHPNAYNPAAHETVIQPNVSIIDADGDEISVLIYDGNVVVDWWSGNGELYETELGRDALSAFIRKLLDAEANLPA